VVAEPGWCRWREAVVGRRRRVRQRISADGDDGGPQSRLGLGVLGDFSPPA
jgi:hypothetical protein